MSSSKVHFVCIKSPVYGEPVQITRIKQADPERGRLLQAGRRELLSANEHLWMIVGHHEGELLAEQAMDYKLMRSDFKSGIISQVEREVDAKVIRWHPDNIKCESFFNGVEARNPSISSYPHLTPREIYWNYFCDDPALKSDFEPYDDPERDNFVTHVGARHDGEYGEDFSVMREDLPSGIAFGSGLENGNNIHDWWINAGIPEWMIARFGKTLLLKSLRKTNDLDLGLVLARSYQKSVEDIRSSLNQWEVSLENPGVWDETNPLSESYSEFFSRASVFARARELYPGNDPFTERGSEFLSPVERRLIEAKADAANRLMLMRDFDDFPSSDTVSKTEFADKLGISAGNLEYVCGLLFENPEDEQMILNVSAEEILLHTAGHLINRRIINDANAFISVLTQRRSLIFPQAQMICGIAHLTALSHDREALYYSVLSSMRR